MRLYIVRHAWAGERDEQEYPDDNLRPVTKEGKERFAEVARRLVARDVCPELIATSPLRRCRQTADIFQAAVGKKTRVVEWAALAPESDLAKLIQATNELNLTEVVWVGHAPDVSELAAALIGGAEAGIRFAKGACAAIDFDEEVAPGRGVLQWLVSAKLLGA